MGYHRHGREPERAPFIIVMPEAKLWIGTYQCFHHAFAGVRKQVEPQKWFVVREGWQPPGWQLIDPWAGWFKLDEPHPLSDFNAHKKLGVRNWRIKW